ncbi:MAG TPA: four helix bundle protein [Opitutaceae bacterium]|nr:four helix bundle protein [Opitutaceae bacterium]
MAKVERFEELRVWQEARVQANALYDETERLKDYAFRDQLRRAAISVMNNVAEGFERRTDADFAHFLDVAKGSNGEVRSMCYLGEDRHYLTAERSAQLRRDAEVLSGGIATLAGYLRQGPRDL